MRTASLALLALLSLAPAAARAQTPPAAPAEGPAPQAAPPPTSTTETTPAPTPEVPPAPAPQAVPPPPAGPAQEFSFVVRDGEGSYDVELISGETHFRCPRAVTRADRCVLTGVPEGDARLVVHGALEINRWITVPAGATRAAFYHRGYTPLVTGLALTVAGSAGLALCAFPNELGCVLGASIGGTAAFFGLVVLLVDVITPRHDVGLVEPSPGAQARRGIRRRPSLAGVGLAPGAQGGAVLGVAVSF